MDKREMLKGIQDEEEKILFAKVLDLAVFALKRYEPQFSDFMDEAKCRRFMERLGGVRGLSVTAFGGTEDCERLMLGLVPEEMTLTDGEFPITALYITVKSQKFAQSDLSHRDYLGSILGLGIDRSKTGDILLFEEGRAVVFVAEDMAAYIASCLDKVSKTAVTVEAGSCAAVSAPKRTETKRMTVASMRLDAIVGEVFHLSRGKAQALITGEKVNVNWSVIAASAHLLKAGDMVSARGFGRFRIGETQGRTKKDRIGLEVEIYI